MSLILFNIYYFVFYDTIGSHNYFYFFCYVKVTQNK